MEKKSALNAISFLANKGAQVSKGAIFDLTKSIFAPTFIDLKAGLGVAPPNPCMTLLAEALGGALLRYWNKYKLNLRTN